jgi:hypothetical protein
VEKIVLSKICQITYWKEQCFGLTAETLIDKAMELDHTDGAYGSNRKTLSPPCSSVSRSRCCKSNPART